MKKTQLRICLVLLANQENGKKGRKGVGRKLHKNVKKLIGGIRIPHVSTAVHINGLRTFSAK